ncbi:FecR family protein [Sphingobacterium sp.]|uniref:FecR family protein n=1 Tax=Sphingobacterium sp. TaxID=341027 RepID=UPI00258AF68F|nr:FecR family protein [Sphingobacterium sp.]WET71102.1 MAG: FecR domain-containing protein [Sphingobacterium sp.]
MQEERLRYLLTHYFRNTISRSELKEMLDQLDQLEEAEFSDLFERMGERIPERSELFNRDQVLNQISSRIGEHHEEIGDERQSKLRYIKWGAIAAAIVVFCFSILFLVQQNAKEITSQQAISPREIALPENGAPILKLSNGDQYSISEEHPETLDKNDLSIVKTTDGTVVYQIRNNGKGKSEMRTFLSPKGSALTVKLIDGTQVQLNSGASLTYPTHFDDHTRTVSLDGEAYFDVTHDSSKPFIVQTKQTQIKVLGTQFNIASDLSKTKILTTLIKGKVAVAAGHNQQILSPGMQAQTNLHTKQIVVQEADLKEVLAWRDGFFRFTEDNIETVLQKVGEWYDIKEVKVNSSSSDKFTGMIKRTKKLSDLLRQLEKISNYKFKIQDGRVLVM